MKEKILKEIYELLKNKFINYPKSNWIWVDYFKDSEKGYEYFKSQILDDKNYDYLKDESFIKSHNMHEMADFIADSIGDELKGNDFISSLITDRYEY